MSEHLNPQAAQMGDESMLRTLAAQAEAIWPQERPLFTRYGLGARAKIADVGCGSGEITARLAAQHLDAEIVGVDILDSVITHARERHRALAPRVSFEQGDAFALRFADDTFDVVLCRHMTQAVPHPERVLAELKRITKPGGWLHVLSEDYGMMHMTAGALDPDRLWHEGAIPFTASGGADARVGRRTWSLLRALGIEELRVDYAVVDTERVPRAVFAAIIEAWRDGYADGMAAATSLRGGEARALFDQIIASIRDPEQYAVWHVPILSGRKPPR